MHKISENHISFPKKILNKKNNISVKDMNRNGNMKNHIGKNDSSDKLPRKLSLD